MYFKKKQSWFRSMYLGEKIILLIFVGGLLAGAFFIFNKVYKADGNVLHVYFLPLLAGLVYELKSITRQWSAVAIVTVVSLFISFLTHIKSKEGNYQAWPYLFLACFTISSFIAFLFSEQTKKVTEGITLLFTIAVNYWILANGYWDSGGTFIKAAVIINWIASIFSIYHAVSYRSLNEMNRVLLSIWYAIAGLVLAADNWYQLYLRRNAEMITSSADTWILFFQYFLLGVSAIYIVQNILLVAAYCFMVKGYVAMLEDVHSVHLKRFSEEQVYIIDALIVIVVSVSLFTFNYFYQFVPVNFMIWAVITIMSVLLYLIHKIIA